MAMHDPSQLATFSQSQRLPLRLFLLSGKFGSKCRCSSVGVILKQTEARCALSNPPKTCQTRILGGFRLTGMASIVELHSHPGLSSTVRGLALTSAHHIVLWSEASGAVGEHLYKVSAGEPRGLRQGTFAQTPKLSQMKLMGRKASHIWSPPLIKRSSGTAAAFTVLARPV